MHSCLLLPSSMRATSSPAKSTLTCSSRSPSKASRSRCVLSITSFAYFNSVFFMRSLDHTRGDPGRPRGTAVPQYRDRSMDTNRALTRWLESDQVNQWKIYLVFLPYAPPQRSKPRIERRRKRCLSRFLKEGARFVLIVTVKRRLLGVNQTYE